MTGHSAAKRVLTLATLFALEIAVISFAWDGPSLPLGNPATNFLRQWGASLLRFVVSFCAISGATVWLTRRDLPARSVPGPLNLRLLAAHAGALALFVILSRQLFQPGVPGIAFLAALWFVTAAASLCCAALAFLPMRYWNRLIFPERYRIMASLFVTGLVAFTGSLVRELWPGTAAVTFRLASALLNLVTTKVVSSPSALTLGTPRFSVEITSLCSGYEGISLITAFAVVWLVLFRKECRFPQALLLIPAGVVMIFLLNALRIATLILIGDRGFTTLALGGFHSQAGWLAFNVVALGFSVTAHEAAWFRSRDRHHERFDNPVAPWVLPLVILLGAGMIAHLATAGFEWLYPIRFFAGAAVLWHFRASYRSFDWRISWRGPATGVLVFAIWLVPDRLAGITAAPVPQDLASAPAWSGASWLLIRILAACLTVPLIEELAFRGFLLRRFTSPEFETVPYAAVSFSAILTTSVAFGALHGDRWLAASLAGFLYSAVTIRTGRLSEAIAAHATTNALIAVAVLAFHQWQLW